jgi:hypothetical protein
MIKTKEFFYLICLFFLSNRKLLDVDHQLVRLVDILSLQVNPENVLLEIIQAFHSVK